MSVTINTKSRADLKAYFQVGKRPTEAQFSDFIDAMPNIKDDSLMTKVQKIIFFITKRKKAL